MVQLYFLSPEELRARVDAFMESGGKEKLKETIARAEEASRRIRRMLTPNPNTLNKHMDF